MILFRILFQDCIELRPWSAAAGGVYLLRRLLPMGVAASAAAAELRRDNLDILPPSSSWVLVLAGGWARGRGCKRKSSLGK